MGKLSNNYNSFESHIAGIPCLIAITDYEPVTPAVLNAPYDQCYPEEGGVQEWLVLDRKGYRATWLSNKMTPQDEFRILEEIDRFLKNSEDIY